MEDVEVIVVDSSAIIAHDLLLSLTEAVTTPQVLNELKDRASKLRAEVAIFMRKLKVIEPDPKYLSTVEKLASLEGDLNKLSTTDLSILALALQLKEQGQGVTILTDDYTVMNIAQKLGLSYKPVKTAGIKTVLKWIKYCPNCGIVYRGKLSECPICGTTLKIKGVKRKALSRG